MLRTMKELEGYAIRATDGDIGRVKDVYFDDERWVVRYLVVETGSWLSSRKVLISPFALGQPDWAGKVLPVSITQQQVKNSPDIDTDKPVSRQHEMQYLGYYGYPYYWGGAGLWGSGLSPSMMLTSGGYGGRYTGNDSVSAERDEDGDPHLRSCKAMMGYHIEASNGGIGHVRDLLVDENTWAVRYMIVDTSNWWRGHEVLIAPQWIQDVRWPDNTVSVNMTQQDVKDAPPYDATVPLSRDQEVGLYRHHGRTGYWAEEAQLENPQFHAATPAPHGSGNRTGGSGGTGSGQDRPPPG